jgi:hypothetical protein
MYQWYRKSVKCYAYLTDVSFDGSVNQTSQPPVWRESFHKSRWFTRGWTLQELLAPRSVEFFSAEGVKLGSKETLRTELHAITGIPKAALLGAFLYEFDVDERMRWAANRQTKREEDAAYSLFGIFDVHMPLLYGEGRKSAMSRLHKEIKDSMAKEPVTALTSETQNLKMSNKV